MATRVTWVRYGRPATEALCQVIASTKADDPLAPVTVVVPSNGVGVAARRLLAGGTLGPLSSRGTGLAAVGFFTVYRLAELLGAQVLAASGRRPVSTPVIAASLRRAFMAQPGVFVSVADHPSTETAVLEAYRELRDCSPEALQALASRSARAADVVRLTMAARTLLEERFFDEEDLIDAAAAEVERDAAVLESFGPLVVHLPERLSRHGAKLLATLADRCNLHVLAGTTGEPAADYEVVLSLRRLLGSAEVPAPPAGGSLTEVVSADRTRLLTTSDADEEVRAAVRAVMDAVRSGTPLDRIALLYASPEPYARTLHDQLSAAGINYNGSAVLTPTARVAGRSLLGLFRLPERGFRRDDVFAWLAGARLRHDGHAVPVGAWERISRDAGVVAGRSQWDRQLTHYVQSRSADIEEVEGDPDAPPWKADQLRREAEQAGSLRSFVLGGIDQLNAVAGAPQPWSTRARWAQELLRRLLGGDRVRERWPLVEQRAAERVERALARLGCLDEVEPEVGFDVFVRTLELELDADLGRVGRMGEGVLVGSIGMGVGQDLDLVVVLGLVEGSFPSTVRDDSLLPDHERAATGDELGRRSQITQRQHRQLLASLAGASAQLLCVPRGDLRKSAERVPSRWALEVASTLAGTRLWREDLLGADTDWLSNGASYDAGLRDLSWPTTPQEYRLRALIAAGGGQRAAASAVDDAVLATGNSMLLARRSDRFTRFDGNLAGLTIPSPVNGAISATALEGWAVCPIAYLARQILGVEEVERPEDRLRISNLDWGSLVHEVLERFITEVLKRPYDRQPEPKHPWTEADFARMRAIADEVCNRYEAQGLVGRNIFWRQDKRHIVADLERFLREDSAHRAAHGTRPIAAELAFGLRGVALGTVALALPDGRQVDFRGKADRVDAASDDSLEVIDYKTGKVDGYKDLGEANPDMAGRRLQLVVYGLAARAQQGRPDATVRAEYWFTSRKGAFKRIGYPVTSEVVERVGATVAQMVDGIETGVFPAVPSGTSTATRVECAYCDPDSLGVVDLRRQMERKHGDPALRVYLELAGAIDEAPSAEDDDG